MDDDRGFHGQLCGLGVRLRLCGRRGRIERATDKGSPAQRPGELGDEESASAQNGARSGLLPSETERWISGVEQEVVYEVACGMEHDDNHERSHQLREEVRKNISGIRSERARTMQLLSEMRKHTAQLQVLTKRWRRNDDGRSS